MPENNDFFIARQEAIDRMREMARNAEEFGIPAPPFVKRRANSREEQRRKNPPPPPPHKPPPPPPKEERPESGEGFLKDIFSKINLHFLGTEGESDTTLLLALLLLLLDKDGDKLLLYALIYILL